MRYQVTRLSPPTTRNKQKMKGKVEARPSNHFDCVKAINQIYCQILHLLSRSYDAAQGVELMCTAVCNSNLAYADQCLI